MSEPSGPDRPTDAPTGLTTHLRECCALVAESQPNDLISLLWRALVEAEVRAAALAGTAPAYDVAQEAAAFLSALAFDLANILPRDVIALCRAHARALAVGAPAAQAPEPTIQGIATAPTVEQGPLYSGGPAGSPAEPPPAENTESRLRQMREDLTWRIGWAAKNDDGEGVALFIALATAIDNVLDFCGLRAAPPPSEAPTDG